LPFSSQGQTMPIGLPHPKLYVMPKSGAMFSWSSLCQTKIPFCNLCSNIWVTGMHKSKWSMHLVHRGQQNHHVLNRSHSLGQCAQWDWVKLLKSGRTIGWMHHCGGWMLHGPSLAIHNGTKVRKYTFQALSLYSKSSHAVVTSMCCLVSTDLPQKESTL